MYFMIVFVFNSLKALLVQNVWIAIYKKSLLYAVFLCTQSNLMVFCVLKTVWYKLS